MKTLLSSLLSCAFAASISVAACSPSGTGSCSNGVLDPGETDVDCGGFCGACAAGQRCFQPTDCASLDCVGNVCSASAASCSDGRKNALETDVDCGGGACPACSATKTCAQATDCVSQSCQGGTCALPATCNDVTLTPGETDVDCGGPCLACAVGKTCREHADCLSATCVFGLCAAPTCDDGVRNQGEPSVDCGGPCAPCQLGQNCGAPADCASGACEGGACCTPNACGFCGESPTDACDGFDNDCDGQTDGADEIGPPPTCDKQDGVCEGASARCAGEPGWVCEDGDYAAHDARYQPTELSCDGVDNDCDGLTDEGDDIPNQPACAKQLGVCAGAVAPCHGAQGATCLTADYVGHDDAYQEVETLCDGVDNDCDGQTDEGLRDQCGNCGGQLVEVCDGVDNDCNGKTDEGLLNACGTCGPAPTERCNGLDDNCDGHTDEAAECAACTAAPIVIKDPTFPKQTKSSSWGGAAFRLASGRMCGYFRADGDDGDNVYDNRAIFYCVDGTTPTIFRRIKDLRTGTNHDRKIMAAVPLGEDIVYYVRDSDTANDWSRSYEIHRLTTGGSDQNISASFPELGDDVNIALGSSGDAVFVLAYPAYTTGTLTLTTLTATGSPTHQTFAGADVNDAVVMAPRVAGGQPTVAFLEGAFGASSATWKIWRGGSVIGTRPGNYDLSDGFAEDSAGRLHFADDSSSSQLRYQRFAQGSWTDWASNGTGSNLYYPVVALQPNDTPWIVALKSYPEEVFRLLPVVEGQASDAVTTRSLGESRADFPTGVIATDEPRLHLFYSDQRGFWNSNVTAEVAATWGYYMQMCPGISDPE